MTTTPPVVDTLFCLARKIEDFLNDHTEELDIGQYDELRECETKLLAFGNLLSAFNRDAFLQDEIVQAADCLGYIRQRIGRAP